MAWIYKSAIRKGDSVVVELENDDPASTEKTQSYTWGRGNMAWAKFKAMLKREVGILVGHLNSTATPEDITAQLT